MLYHYWVRVLALARHARRYIRSFVKWSCYAGITGLIGGFVGMFFTSAVRWATSARTGHPVLLYFLPIAGLAIVGLYDIFNSYEDNNTDTVVESINKKGKRVPFIIAPLIFISTVLTHLCGGSAGREGAALQLGGSIGTQVGNWFEVGKNEMSVLIMCGMSALFSALFGTPVAAMFFAMEVSIVGVMKYTALVPCMVASMTAFAVTRFNNVEPERFAIASIPNADIKCMLTVVVLAALCAILSMIFCRALKQTEKAMGGIKNEYIRIVVGAGIIILLTNIVGSGDYNGSGMDIIRKAAEQGQAEPFAFLFKIVFTAVTIAAGFKGGEIVPTLFIGATFGCVMGGLLGLDPSFGAAIGMTAMFCGVLNCPIASIFLALELFGSQGLEFFVAAAGVSYMLSGYSGLYSTQRFLTSKLRAEYVNKHAGK